ncbi:MAG: hypothetical protein VX642_11435 [Bdellovibrionota bacterium]|nr:hypothetical protein [Bdellovibrionota bacterium]
MHEKDVFHILKSFRDDREQQEMDKILSLPKTSFHRLESGYKKFYLNDFLEFSRKLGLENKLDRCFRKSIGLSILEKNDSQVLDEFFDLYGEPRFEFVESDLKMSASTWWRLKKHKTSLSLNDFLILTKYQSGKFTNFMAEFAQEFLQDRLANSSFYEYLNFISMNPEFGVLSAALDIPREDELSLTLHLEKLTGIATERIEELIHEVLKYDYGKMIDGTLKLYHEKLAFRQNQTSYSWYFGQYVLQRALTANEQSFIRRSYLIKAISSKAQNDILKLQIQFYKDLMQVIELDRGERLDQVMLMSIVSLNAGKRNI